MFSFRIILDAPAIWRGNALKYLGKNSPQLSGRQEGSGGGCWGMNWKEPWVPHGDGPFFVETAMISVRRGLVRQKVFTALPPGHLQLSYTCYADQSSGWRKMTDTHKMPEWFYKFGIEKNPNTWKNKTTTNRSGYGSRAKRKEGLDRGRRKIFCEDF